MMVMKSGLAILEMYPDTESIEFTQGTWQQSFLHIPKTSIFKFFLLLILGDLVVNSSIGNY